MLQVLSFTSDISLATDDERLSSRGDGYGDVSDEGLAWVTGSCSNRSGYI